MRTIIIPLVKEGNTIVYPESPSSLFKHGVVIGLELACDYYGELDTYTPYTWPLEYQRLYSPYEFMTLLGFNTRVAMRGATDDPIIEDFVSMMDAAKELDLDNQDMINGLNYMASTGVITQEEADRILLGNPL